MADIFISYAKLHAQLTEDLANDLEAQGFTTWWDTSLLPGDEFSEQIKREIDTSQAVIVIWTESSVASPWVRAEANRAYQLRKLITVHATGLNLEQVPLPFNTLQSSLVTDRAKLFAALSKRGIRPRGYVLSNSVQEVDTESRRADIATPSMANGGDFTAENLADTDYGVVAEAPTTRPEDAELLRLEEEAWKLVFAKRDPKLALSFHERFPSGKYAEEAKKRAEMLTKLGNTKSRREAIFSIIFSVLIFGIIKDMIRVCKTCSTGEFIFQILLAIFALGIIYMVIDTLLNSFMPKEALEQNVASQERLHGIESSSNAR